MNLDPGTEGDLTTVTQLTQRPLHNHKGHGFLCAAAVMLPQGINKCHLDAAGCPFVLPEMSLKLSAMCFLWDLKYSLTWDNIHGEELLLQW